MWRWLTPVLLAFSATSLSAQEICNNGIDDDGDGQVDCYDFDCVTNANCDGFFYGYPISHCEIEPPTGPLGINLVWSSSVNIATRSLALVGDIDADGVPEVVARNNGANQVYILDGVTGNLEVTINAPSFMSVSNSLAIADTDNDGFGEIYVTPNDGNLYCYEHNGTSKAGFAVNNIGFTETAPGIADFNGDGVPEVYIGNQIFHSQTGALIASGGSGSKGQNRNFAWHPVAVDLLPDGLCPDCSGLELACGNTVYTVDINGGNITPLPNNLVGLADGFTSVADVNGDGNLDVIVTSQGTVYMWNPLTGNQLGNTFVLPGTTHGGRPNVADYDNDGLPEIGAGGQDIYVVIDINPVTQALTTLWTQTIVDGSQMTTGSAFDFEGDGITEVVYRDENNLFVWDGATGAIKVQTQCGSATRTDFPTVADVNGDGQANIICICADLDGGEPGKVRVYESSGIPWIPTREVMNQHTYSVTNINDDLTVPISPQNNAVFPKMNNFLSQALQYDIFWEPVLLPVADLTISIDTVVFCQNPNEFELTLNICNEGSYRVDGVIPITLYNGNPNAGGSVIDNLTFNPSSLDTATCVLQTYNVAWDELPFELFALVDDDGSNPTTAPVNVHDECDYSNNSTSMQINGIHVDPIISGFDPPYCFTDTVIELTGTPVGGTFSGSGITGTTFNPIDALPGIHAITYDYSFGVCAFDTTVSVEVRPPLIVNAGTDTAFCSEQAVNLGTTTLTGYTYTWQPNAGLSDASSSTPTLTLNNFGTSNDVQTYTLTVDSAWCTAQDEMTATVYPHPYSDFELMNVCLNVPNQFTSLSDAYTGSIDSFSWDFGDNENDSVVDPTHIYQNPGIYSVELEILTSNGCADDTTLQLEVYNLPVADFSTQNVCQVDTALLIENSSSLSGDVVDWMWNLGDGDTALVHTASNISHFYQADGTYDLQLIVNTEFGCSDTIQDSIIIFPVPTTDFVFDTACFTHPTQFTDLTLINTGAISQWIWDFGGTGNSQTQNPQHIFPAPGSYEVSLTVFSDNGCKGDALDTILVYDLPEPEFSTEPVCHEQSMVFSDSSTIANGSIANYYWDFGDQSSSTLINPTHVYPSAGFYTVQLKLTSDVACMDSITQQVEVYPLPEVAFSANPEEGCMPLLVQFLDQTSITAPYQLAEWIWNFGDSTLATTRNTTHTYPVAGTYSISLIVTSRNDCVSSDTIIDMITVHQKPDAGFSADPNPVSILFPKVWFMDESVGAVNWYWDFGDGQISTEQNPIHSYLDVSENDVWQIVSTEFDCLDTAIHKIAVEPQFTLYVPSAFTPNDDGRNDEFKAEGIGITEFAMDIYNRWGEHLFHTKNMDLGWNGRKNNEGIDLKMGVYVYRITVIDFEGHSHERTGSISLVR